MKSWGVLWSLYEYRRASQEKQVRNSAREACYWFAHGDAWWGIYGNLIIESYWMFSFVSNRGVTSFTSQAKPWNTTWCQETWGQSPAHTPLMPRRARNTCQLQKRDAVFWAFFFGKIYHALPSGEANSSEMFLSTCFVKPSFAMMPLWHSKFNE